MITEEDKTILRRFMDARVKNDTNQAAAKKSKKELDEIELEVFYHFEDSGVVGSIKVDLGPPHGVVSFRTRETYFADVVDEDQALEYYEQQAALDDIELSEEDLEKAKQFYKTYREGVMAPKFIMKELNSDVRADIESGNLDAISKKGLTYYARRGMTVTKQK